MDDKQRLERKGVNATSLGKMTNSCVLNSLQKSPNDATAFITPPLTFYHSGGSHFAAPVIHPSAVIKEKKTNKLGEHASYCVCTC